MKLKVCGMKKLEQLQTLESLGVDFAGLIFYEKSKRFIGEELKDKAGEIGNLKIEKVGVFVNAGIETIKAKTKDYGLNHIQLHGDENPGFCKEVKEFASVIKAIRIASGIIMEDKLDQYADGCDYFLFDTESKQYGGTGKQFDWDILNSVNIQKPFFLSGGIGLEDISKVKSFAHPMLFAIDINSKFETSFGVKDLKQVEIFLKSLK
jgi:phosphoribosylanthranilate isomerase